MLIAIYIFAMVAANLLVWRLGPWFAPINAFVLIGHHYTLLIEADKMIKVEDLLSVLARYAERAMFQEDITADIASRLASVSKVTTSGFHSGVETVCSVEPSQ